MSKNSEETGSNEQTETAKGKTLWQRICGYLAGIMKPAEVPPSSDGFDHYLAPGSAYAWRNYPGIHRMCF